MRKAAVLAKLISDTSAGHARLSFVTEGEASLHFAVQNGFPIGVMENGEGVVIVDAGGGTIDISSYSKNVGGAKATFEEVAVPRCEIYLIIYDFYFFQTLPTRPFSWISLCDGACPTIFRGCVLRYVHQILITFNAL